jgi:hypothetical protein
MINVEVVEDANIGSRVANGIQDKDRDDEQGKDFVGESGGELDDSVQIHECRQEHVKRNPDSNPRIKGQERNVQGLGELEHNGLKGQDRTGTTVDHLNTW